MNNPYRQLGVYSTSSQKEEVSNQGKMKAFLKVGRPVTFPLDLVGVLPPLSRTEQGVAEAVSRLTLPTERLKYAQFWFAKCTQIDEIACNKLIAGDLNGAIDIWSKKATASSLQNLVTCSLIKKEIAAAIGYAERLYTQFADVFVKMIIGEGAAEPTYHLVHGFLDALCEMFEPHQILECITAPEWKEYVGSKSTQPLIEKIAAAIEVCKSSKEDRHNAGRKLMNDTKEALAQLRSLVSADDLQYQLLADRLGLEVLQCGIDYFNGAKEPDAAHKAMVLQKYAQSVVVGKMAKDRCKENIDVLSQIIATLPPPEVFAEDSAIKEELRKFRMLPDKIRHSVNLLNATKPHLQIVKRKLGPANRYYLKLSTQVVSHALHNVIEEVNGVQNDATFKINMMVDKSAALASLKSVMRSAMDAVRIMDTFDMESDFKSQRYNENRRILENMHGQIVGISLPDSTHQSTLSSENNGCLQGIICVAVGTVLGAIIGAVAGDAGIGASIGAFFGFLVYGIKY